MYNLQKRSFVTTFRGHQSLCRVQRVRHTYSATTLHAPPAFHPIPMENYLCAFFVLVDIFIVKLVELCTVVLVGVGLLLGPPPLPLWNVSRV